MIIGWWCLIASSIIFAKHYKIVWGESKKIYGKATWFRLHQSLNTIGIICIIAAFVIIFIQVNGLTDDVRKNKFIFKFQKFFHFQFFFIVGIFF